MADIILHRRSFDTGSVPTTASLGVAQFAINVPDGKVFIHKSSSVSQSIVSVVTANSITTGSITLTATASAALFIGTFTGSFSGVATNAQTASYVQNLSNINQVSDTTTTASFGQLLVKSQSRWISSTSLTGSYSLSGSLNLFQSRSVSGTNIFGTASWSDNATTASFVDVRINKEWHVSSGSGDDTIGDGSLLHPFKTLARASSSLGNTGERVILHPGTYTGDVTFSQLNFSITTPGDVAPGEIAVNGTLTFTGGSSSNKLGGFTVTNIVQSGNATLYLDSMTVTGTTVKSGTGYFECQNVSLSQVSTVTISNSGTCVFQGGKIGLLTVTNASAVISILNCMTAVRPVVNAGTLLINGSVVYSLSSGSAAVSASATSTVFLQNSSFYNPLGAAERVILGGSFGLDDVIFNRLNSTFGTSLGARAHFQQIQADGITGSLNGSVSNADTASFANTGFTINSSSLFSLARTSSNLGVNTFTVATGSSRGSVLNYTVTSASNGRTGQVMTSWVGSNTVFAETHTPDIGNTSGVSFTSSLSGANVVYNFGTATAGWNLEFLVTHI